VEKLKERLQAEITALGHAVSDQTVGNILRRCAKSQEQDRSLSRPTRRLAKVLLASRLIL
jgi:hypothetical protein